MNLKKQLLSILAVILISPILLHAAFRRQAAQYTTSQIKPNTRFLSQYAPQPVGMSRWQGARMNQPYAGMSTNFPVAQATSVTTQQRAYSTNKPAPNQQYKSGSQNKRNNPQSSYEILSALGLAGSSLALLEAYERYTYPGSTVYTLWSTPPTESATQEDSSLSFDQQVWNALSKEYKAPTDEDFLNELSRRTNGAVSSKTHRIIYKFLSRYGHWRVRVQPKSEMNTPSQE